MTKKTQMIIPAGYALEILLTETYTGLEKAVVWIQRKIREEMKTTEKRKNAQNKILDHYSFSAD